jgi:hypothetical protein
LAKCYSTIVVKINKNIKETYIKEKWKIKELVIIITEIKK